MDLSKLIFWDNSQRRKCCITDSNDLLLLTESILEYFHIFPISNDTKHVTRLNESSEVSDPTNYGCVCLFHLMLNRTFFELNA